MSEPGNLSSETNDARAISRFEDIPPFLPHRWYRGGWLQTISVKQMRSDLLLESRRDAIAISIVDDHSPPDELTGYYLPRSIDRGRKPLVVVFHGMGGEALSPYMRSMAGHLNQHGFDAILWNHRGAGQSAKSCSRLHHPGLSEDVERLLHYLHDKRERWTNDGLACVAFSLGANVLLKYLAEAKQCSKFDLAVAISAPLDMAVTSRNLQSGMNRVFDRYLLSKQREELLRESAKLTDEEKEIVANVESVWDLDDRFTAIRLGHSGAEEFYQANSAIHTIDQISTPTLLLHAKDDPVVDANVFNGVDWDSNSNLFPAMVDSGGHTGFLDVNGNRWHERAAVAFLDAMSKHSPPSHGVPD